MRPFRICTFALFVLLVSTCVQAQQPATGSIDDPVYTHASHLVEIEPGRHLNLYCTGNGSPTVILEAGMDSSTVVWALLQPRIAATTRVCAYDRAGMGFSDASRRPSTSVNIVDDLHALLKAAAIEPPYVLVGHSSAGIHMRLYAATYPKGIVGMVLVDPSSEYQDDSYRKLDSRHLTPQQWQDYLGAGWGTSRQCIAAAEAGSLNSKNALYGKCVDAPEPVFVDAIQRAMDTFEMGAGYQRAALSEEQNFWASQLELQKAHRDLGDLPLIVLTEGVRRPPAKPMPADKLAAREARDRLWIQLNAQIATWSKQGTQQIIPDVGHAIQLERPDLVAAAISDVLKTARHGRPGVGTP